MARNGATRFLTVYAIPESRATRWKLVARRGKTGWGPIVAVLSADPSWNGWKFLVDQYLAFLRSDYEVFLDPSAVHIIKGGK